jgi:DNA-binding NtrC family response regulator
VDDDKIILESLCEFLELEGYETAGAIGFREALALLEKKQFGLVVTDINLQDSDGFELLHVIKKRFPHVAVIMITGYGTIESAVEAIKMGAFDYLTKPIVDEELKLRVDRALAQQALIRENQQLRDQLGMRYSLDSIVGHHYKMLKIFDLIETVADTKANVLIQGESGTGKSLIARAVHYRSQRRDGPFVEVSCGAIPESLLESELFGHVKGAFTGAVRDNPGKFKAADGGTIFLDEISAASPALQVKLLRVLQERQLEPVGSNKTETVDVRVILASNSDLADEVKAGRFRQDLYYRINVVTIPLCPLRERPSDIPLLADHFLKKYCEEVGRELLGFTEQAKEALTRYHWPGNVRELENVVERSVVLARGRYVGVDLLPAEVTDAVAVESSSEEEYKPCSLKRALEEPEKRIIERALRANNWNRQLTADVLEINRTTLYKKMKRYGLEADPAAVRV